METNIIQKIAFVIVTMIYLSFLIGCWWLYFDSIKFEAIYLLLTIPLMLLLTGCIFYAWGSAMEFIELW